MTDRQHSRAKKDWSLAEVETLRQLWPNASVVQISAAIGRSVAAIRKKATQEGISKSQAHRDRWRVRRAAEEAAKSYPVAGKPPARMSPEQAALAAPIYAPLRSAERIERMRLRILAGLPPILPGDGAPIASVGQCRTCLSPPLPYSELCARCAETMRRAESCGDFDGR